jgi:uncharacterized membrane protein
MTGKKNRLTKFDWLFLLIVAILTIALASHLLRRSFWFDEAFTGILVRMPWRDLWAQIIEDTHPPLYYSLLKIYSFANPNNDLLLRSFSLIAHLITGFYIYLLAARWGKANQLIATLIYAINPFFLHYATEARMYSLLGLWVVASVYYLSQALEYNQAKKRFSLDYNRYYVFFGITCFLALVTHYFAGFLVAIGLPFLLFQQNSPRLSKEKLLKLLKIWALPLGLFALWLPFFLHQALDSPGTSWIPTLRNWGKFTEVSFPAFWYGILTFGGGVVMVESFKISLGPLGSFNLFFFHSLLFWFLIIGLVWLQKKIIKDKILLLIELLAFIPFLVVTLLSVEFGINYYVERYFLPFAIMLVLFTIYLSLKIIPRKLVITLWSLYLIVLIPFGLTREINRDFKVLDQKMLDYPGGTTYVFGEYQEYLVARYYWEDRKVFYYNYRNQDADLASWQQIAQDDKIRSAAEMPEDYFFIAKTVNFNTFESRIINQLNLKQLEQLGEYAVYQKD